MYFNYMKMRMFLVCWRGISRNLGWNTETYCEELTVWELAGWPAGLSHFLPMVTEESEKAQQTPLGLDVGLIFQANRFSREKAPQWHGSDILPEWTALTAWLRVPQTQVQVRLGPLASCTWQSLNFWSLSVFSHGSSSQPPGILGRMKWGHADTMCSREQAFNKLWWLLILH